MNLIIITNQNLTYYFVYSICNNIFSYRNIIDETLPYAAFLYIGHTEQVVSSTNKPSQSILRAFYVLTLIIIFLEFS